MDKSKKKKRFVLIQRYGKSYSSAFPWKQMIMTLWSSALFNKYRIFKQYTSFTHISFFADTDFKSKNTDHGQQTFYHEYLKERASAKQLWQ